MRKILLSTALLFFVLTLRPNSTADSLIFLIHKAKIQFDTIEVFKLYNLLGKEYIRLNKPHLAVEALRCAIMPAIWENGLINKKLLKIADHMQEAKWIKISVVILVIFSLIVIVMLLYHHTKIKENSKAITGIRLRLEAMLNLLTFAKDNVAYERKDQAIKDIEMVERIGREAKGRAS